MQSTFLWGETQSISDSECLLIGQDTTTMYGFSKQRCNKLMRVEAETA